MANENVKNIFGIDLNVDKDYLSDIVKKSVMSSVAQALTDGDNGCIAQGIVNAALSVKVKKDSGAIADDYDVRNDRACSLMEYYVRKAITEAFKEELKELVQQKKEDFRKLLTKAINTKKHQDNLIESFLASMIDNCNYVNGANVNIEFKHASRY
jgi:hypothetical protein